MRDFGKIRERRTASGETRYWVDLRTEIARLGRPAKVGRVYSMPTLAGPRVFKIREDAEAALHYIRSKVAAGGPLPAVLDSFRPFGESHVLRCAERWVEHQYKRADAGQLSRGGVKALEGRIRRHWPAKWDGVCTHEIRKHHLEDWTMELQSSGYAPATVVVLLSNLRAMLVWLKDRQEILDVPAFPSVAIPDHAPRLLTREQQTAVLDEIAIEQRGIYLALADLWLRPNEGRALRPAAYEVVKHRTDEDPAGWMAIKRAAEGQRADAPIREWTKTGTIRNLPVSDRLADWIAEHVPADARVTRELLFPAPDGRTWAHATLAHRWKQACKRAGVPIVPVREGTRHSSATAARRDKWPLDLIQRFLGHTDVRNTERYSRHHDQALVALVTGRR
jgi:integrase